jgi:uncharacterized membrane protein YiaA
MQDPFPQYLTLYPLHLISNSLLTFGVLPLFAQTSEYLFYVLSAAMCLTFGFWVETKNVNAVFDAALKRLADGD